MIKIFGDKIDDFLFPNESKKFTHQEKTIIDQFLVSLIKLYKNSELEDSANYPHYDRIDYVTEVIRKYITLNDESFAFCFAKVFRSGVNKNHYIPYTQFIYDGETSRSFESSEKFRKELDKEKVISGIYVSCIKGNEGYIIGEGGELFTHDYAIRTRYDGGAKLTDQCLNRIKNFHFKKFNKIIKDSLKSKKKKKKK